MPRNVRLHVLREARRLLRPGGGLVVLELDEPSGRAWRWFVALWLFYWLPFNFETPTRRDMLRHGLVHEVEEAGFREVRKTSVSRGALQLVQAER